MRHGSTVDRGLQLLLCAALAQKTSPLLCTPVDTMITKLARTEKSSAKTRMPSGTSVQMASTASSREPLLQWQYTTAGNKRVSPRLEPLLPSISQ
jgi:hypothetical protein